MPMTEDDVRRFFAGDPAALERALARLNGERRHTGPTVKTDTPKPKSSPPQHTHRRLVPRYAWPAAQDALRHARVSWLADAVHDQHAVLVSTTGKGAATLDGLGARPANGVARPEPPPLPAPPRDTGRGDPLEEAFRRARDEARARAA